MLNLVVVLQLLTIILSRGDIFILGEAYAFGVMWSFSMKGLAVLVLRYKQPGKRDFRVPLNFTMGNVEIPSVWPDYSDALCPEHHESFHQASGNHCRRGITIIFFTVFEISEKITLRHGAKHQELDMFNLESDGELTPASLSVRPGKRAR